MAVERDGKHLERGLADVAIQVSHYTSFFQSHSCSGTNHPGIPEKLVDVLPRLTTY
jgi:hypothetical protein